MFYLFILRNSIIWYNEIGDLMKKERLNIIYEDKDLLVVDKKSGLLTISTDNEKEKTLYHQVYTYLKKKHKNNKVFIVHRLDRDTSGIVLFAKNEKMKYALQNKWNEITKREYVCVVEGIVEKNKDTLKDYLSETKTLRTFSTAPRNGKLAITMYEKLSTGKNNTLLKIIIKTGRKNQIRFQLSNIGYPIVGDKKYGSKTNPLKRLGLHANKLELIHPFTKKTIVFETKIPESFLKIFPIDV